MKAVAQTLGLARSNLAAQMKQRPPKRVGRPPLPDEDLVAEIKAIIAELPTYGYRRVHAILRRRARADGRPAPNHKRVYRVMKVHDLLLQRHAGGADQCRHDGRIAVEVSNRRWCSDGFEIGCDNGERVRSIAVTERPSAMWRAPAASVETTCAISWWRRWRAGSAGSTACPSRLSGCRTTARLLWPATRAGLPVRWDWRHAPLRSGALRAMELPRHS